MQLTVHEYSFLMLLILLFHEITLQSQGRMYLSSIVLFWNWSFALSNSATSLLHSLRRLSLHLSHGLPSPFLPGRSSRRSLWSRMTFRVSDMASLIRVWSWLSWWHSFWSSVKGIHVILAIFIDRNAIFKNTKFNNFSVRCS